MELSKKLKEQGWHLTEDGIKRVSSESTDIRKIIAAALDMDFRDIAGGALPTKREDSITGQIVLQVQKVRNISAPKSNEDSKAAPRFLQLELSDGQTSLQALELEPVSALSLNMPPGTKLYFRTERLQLMQGFLILRNSELQVLGGRVEALVEKWELARAMQEYTRGGRRMSGTAGPPPWIAFGKKIEGLQETLPQERNFKSLQAATEKDKEGKDNEEFNAMRNEAIAEATKAGARKVFGGGGQQILDHNVKKILEKGYSEEDAKQALRTTNNNLERALYNLKRRQDYNRNDESARPSTRGAPVREMGGKRGVATTKDEAAAAKPAANVSLLDFLTDKLPVDAKPAVSCTQMLTTNSSNNATTGSEKYDKFRGQDTSKPNYNTSSRATADASSSRPTKFENNISSSFAANRSSGSQRGGRNGNYSERAERPDSYNTDERSSNPRYGSSRGGGNNPRSAPHEQFNSRNYQSTRGNGSERGGIRNSNSHYGAGTRGNNRASNERSTGAQETMSGGITNAAASYDSKRGGARIRGGTERYGNANEGRTYDKSRFNQRDNKPASINNANSNATTTASAEIGDSNVNSSNNNNNNNSEHTTRMNKLAESTAKMTIDKGRAEGNNSRVQQQQSQHQQQSQQQQPQQSQQHQRQRQPASQQQKQYSQPQLQSPNQQSQQYATTTLPTTAQPAIAVYGSAAAQPQHQGTAYTQLPNGFTYDPNKIIGFQSKETNELAMTLLRSQGVSGAAGAQTAQQPPLAVTQPLHTFVPAATAMQPPSPYGPAAPVSYVLSSPPPPTQSNQFGMVSGDGWMWKMGDLCLAKYWDDGRYYEAEITAVSDKTCVVFFLGYGNHEEVLKCDCLPITDANHRPINSYAQAQGMSMQQHQQPPPPSMQTTAFQRGGGGSQRHRGERQVYVPPHKRDN